MVDCQDADTLADFWARALDGSVTREQYGCPQVTTGGGPLLTFIQVPEDKLVKNRLHIDLNPVGSSQAEEIERLLRLGARRIDIGQGTPSWAVLADPEGNEFCVLQPNLDA